MAKVKQEDRDSIADYEQAVWRLVTAYEASGRRVTDDLALAVEIVADIYWCRDSRVWRDILARSRRL